MNTLETLRRAEQEMRKDVDEIDGGGNPFLLGVATWISRTASRWNVETDGDGEVDDALAVARAYLGGEQS